MTAWTDEKQRHHDTAKREQARREGFAGEWCECGNRKAYSAFGCFDCYKKTPFERAMRMVEVGPLGACWQWKGSTLRGYGQVGISSDVKVKAHRLIYEHLIGPIPDELTIDHLCRNLGCVNPLHLEPVTMEENNYRRWRGASWTFRPRQTQRFAPIEPSDIVITTLKRADNGDWHVACSRCGAVGTFARRAPARAAKAVHECEPVYRFARLESVGGA